MIKSTKLLKKSNFADKGFTLVELAIVLASVGLLLALILPPLSAQRDIRLRTETQVLLQQVKEALIGYAVVHRHLPCPDSDAVPDGIENREIDGTCTATGEGILPWNTLGIEKSDAWNRYFGYRPDATFTNSVALFTIADAENASGIIVNDENGALTSTNSRPAAIVISYGANGYGAITTIQATPDNKMPKPAVTALDETENTNDDLTFVSHAPTPAGSVNEFDDLLIWVPPKILVSRMIAAGRLP